MTKKILGIITIVLLVILTIRIFQSGGSAYVGKFAEIDPTGSYRISLVAITDGPQDNALEITDIKKNESVMTIPPEMLIDRIAATDKSLDRNTTIKISETAFLEGNIGPWSKDGTILWGKLKREDGTLYKYYRINLHDRKLEITQSL